MWRDEHHGMLMRSFAVCTVLAIAFSAGAREPSNGLAQIDQAWNKSRSVQFYFVNRTEKYTLTPEAFKKAATIKVYRACGMNCASFMAPVTQHLKTAKPVACQAGQENILIEPSNGPSLMFSQSGRVLKVGVSCYLITTGIDVVLKEKNFFFH